MSLRQRVEQTARDAALEAIQSMIALRNQQATNQEANIGAVYKANGVNLGVTLGDGTNQDVVSISNTAIGTNSYGIVVSGVFIGA